MKTKITIFSVLILFINFSFAQDYCAAPTNTPNQNFSSLSRMIYGNPANEDMICLNIFFHVVRNNDGSGGIRDYETNGIVDNLNSLYNAHKISFSKLGLDYINNTALNNTQSSEIGSLKAINNKSNAINFYIVDAADFNGYGDILGNNVVITKAAAITGVASHEVGHNLNLYHTHETKFGIEIQDDCSSTNTTLCNCTFAGDLLCDTPPDPGLRVDDDTYKVDSNCNYAGPSGYNPDTRNIMSYTMPACLQHFSNQQAIRMRDAILNAPVLQSTINCGCSVTAIFGKSTICSSETTTYSLSCGNASFTKSANLQIISSTSNSITVKPINSSVNEVAFVKTTINGKPYQKDIWIGKPKVNVTLTPDVNYVYLELVGVNSDINKQNINYIEWETLSTSGTATMGSAINLFENLAHGNSTNWIINARIKVQNDCGITYLYKDITPPVPLPCEDYYTINKTGENEYVTYEIIDPCDTLNKNSNVEVSSTKTSNEIEVNSDDIVEAVLLDMYGNRVKEFNSNYFKTDDIKQGVYIFKVKIKNEIIIKRIIVE